MNPKAKHDVMSFTFSLSLNSTVNTKSILYYSYLLNFWSVPKFARVIDVSDGVSDGAPSQVLLPPETKA